VREVVVEGNIAHFVNTVGKGHAVFQRQLVEELGDGQGFPAVLGHGGRRKDEGCRCRSRSVVGVSVVGVTVTVSVCVSVGVCCRGNVLLHQLHSPQVIAQSRVENQYKGFVLNGGGFPFHLVHDDRKTVHLVVGVVHVVVVEWFVFVFVFVFVLAVIFLLAAIGNRSQERVGRHSRNLVPARCDRILVKDLAAATIVVAIVRLLLLLLLLPLLLLPLLLLLQLRVNRCVATTVAVVVVVVVAVAVVVVVDVDIVQIHVTEFVVVFAIVICAIGKVEFEVGIVAIVVVEVCVEV